MDLPTDRRPWNARLTGLAGIALAGLLALAGCAAPGPSPGALAEAYPARPGEPVRTVALIVEGWHAGIAVARDDLPEALVPEAADLPDSTFLEFGWGDRGYYPPPDRSVGLLLTAGMVPTPSVLRLAALPGLPAARDDVAVYRLDLPDSAFHRLLAAIDGSFDRGGEARALPLQAGRSERALFYPAHGRFHLFNTCNTWVARQLAAAGLPVSPAGVVTAGDLQGRLATLPQVTPYSPGSPPPAVLQSAMSNRVPAL